MPFGPADLVWLGLVPCFAAAVAMFVCGRAGARPHAAWAASVACGFVVGKLGVHVRVGGQTRVSWQTAVIKFVRPHEALDWLPWLVIVAAGIGVTAAYAPRSWRRWLAALACVLALAVPARLLAGSVYATSRWSLGEKTAVLVLWAAVFSFEWFTLAAGRANGQPLLRSALLVVVTIGTAMTLALSGSLSLGEIGILAAATIFGAAGSDSAFVRSTDGPSGAAGPVAVTLGSLLLLGHFYAGLTAVNAALLAASLALAGGRLPKLPLRWRGGRGEGFVRGTIALVPLAIAIASAASAAMSDPYR